MIRDPSRYVYLAPFGIKVQTINPGAYLTGYNETMADTAFRWLDDSKNFTKREVLRKTFDDLLATPERPPRSEGNDRSHGRDRACGYREVPKRGTEVC